MQEKPKTKKNCTIFIWGFGWNREKNEPKIRENRETLDWILLYVFLSHHQNEGKKAA
jgi:hypothetical protein